jgi:hypothetical protein
MQEEVNAPQSAGGPSEGSKRFFQQPRIRLGAVVALAVAAGIVAWALIGRDNSSSTPTSTTATKGPVTAAHAAVGLSANGLTTLARRIKQRIYWAGPRPGYIYEVTRLSDGRVFVRYLPPGVKVGDKRAQFLIIATYPFPDALSGLEKVSRGKGIAIRGGGMALVHTTYPKSVHVAFPGVNYQIEVYDPSPKVSLQVARSGEVQRVG